MEYDELIVEFTKAIEETIDNWAHGHKIPLTVTIGVLHAIAHARLTEAMRRGEQADDESEYGE